VKNLKLKPGNLLFNILMAVVVLTALFGASPEVLAAAVPVAFTSGTVIYLFSQSKTLALFAGIQREIWEKDIEEAIFKDNTFITKRKDVSSEVLGGKVVYIPQSGGPGNVVKNRAVKPATVREREDTTVLYEIAEYTSDPLYIPHADTVELSYDKRDSAIKEDKLNLQQEVAEGILYDWTKNVNAARVLRTTGADVVATLGGATGNRKAASLMDLQRARTFLANENRFFNTGMNALVPSNLLAQMFPADNIVTATAMGTVTETERRNGIMYKQQGFDIMERSSVLIVDAAGNLKAPGAVVEATDSEAILLWWGQAVERAMGDIKFFEKLGDPQMYGDIYSFLVRMGGRARRSGNEGIVVLASGVSV